MKKFNGLHPKFTAFWAYFSKKVQIFAKIKGKILVIKKKVLTLHQHLRLNATDPAGSGDKKIKCYVSNAINEHLQENTGDEIVQKNVWPEILYKGRNDCQLRNSQKFNPVFPFRNRTPDCTTFKVINPARATGPQKQPIYEHRFRLQDGYR